MAVKYFFDTYAFYEFIDGNERYKKYFEDYEIVTTRLNLIELFYVLLKNYNLEKARKYYSAFLPFIIDFTDTIVEEVMKFKLKYKERDLSYVDCIGYVLAIFNNLEFLTGDEQFKNLKKVKFVK